MKIKHAKTADRIKYFEPETVDKLAELIETTEPTGRPKKVSLSK